MGNAHSVDADRVVRDHAPRKLDRGRHEILPLVKHQELWLRSVNHVCDRLQEVRLVQRLGRAWALGGLLRQHLLQQIHTFCGVKLKDLQVEVDDAGLIQLQSFLDLVAREGVAPSQPKRIKKRDSSRMYKM